MKKLLFLFLIIPMYLPQNLGDITSAISLGDAKTLSQYLDHTVEISVMGKGDIYTRNQAIDILKGFFASHKPKSFSQVHKGASKTNDSVYCIGNLVTENKTFRVYIYMRVDGGQQFVQELRFDQE